MKSTPLLLALAVCLLLAAPAGAGSDALSPGTYTMKLTDKGPVLNGNWKLKFTTTFAPAGKFLITKNGALKVAGDSAVTGNKVTFVDQSGPLRCKGNQQGGVYSFTLKQKKLTLKALADLCAGRQLVLATKPFTRQ